MKGPRACPICTSCGSKKFERLDGNEPVRVRCLSCGLVISI